MRSPRPTLSEPHRQAGADRLPIEPVTPRRPASAKPAYPTRIVSRRNAGDPRGYGPVSGGQVVPRAAADVVLAVRRADHGWTDGARGLQVSGL